MVTDGCIHDGWLLLKEKDERITKDFLYYILSSDVVYRQFKQAATGGVVNNLNSSLVRSVKLPLPAIDMQNAIVAKFDEEQRLVNANKELIRRFEEKIKQTINRVWGETE